MEKRELKMFIIEIEILSDGEWWDDKRKEFIYHKGKKIFVPIKSNNANAAAQKIERKFSGGEYPSYKINFVHKTDEFLFDYKILQTK